MPDHALCTSTSPSATSGTSTGRTSTRRGAANHTARAFTCAPPPPRRLSCPPVRAEDAMEAAAGPADLAPVGERVAPREVARAPMPTPFGTFEARAFECSSGFVYLALVQGDVDGGGPVLTRVHSECLTGDALGSLRCDCGIQLRHALRAITAEGRGVLVYATGHEGRGVGLVNKLRAYVEQDDGADTLDANLRLGLAVDARDYGEAASVLSALGVRSIRLMT